MVCDLLVGFSRVSAASVEEKLTRVKAHFWWFVEYAVLGFLFFC